MSHRCLESAVLAVVVAVATVSVSGQAPKPAPNPAPAAEQPSAARALVRAKAAKNWKPVRTAWGEPDLQGVWSYATTTPLSKPDAACDKTFLTDEEVAESGRRETPPAHA